MLSVCRFVAIPRSPALQVDGTTVEPAGSFTLPGPTGSGIRQFPLIEAPNLDIKYQILLVFRVSPKVQGTFRMVTHINGQDVSMITFKKDEVQRTWHEIIPHGVLGASNNTLTMQGSVQEEGTVHEEDSVLISDLLLIYHAHLFPVPPTRGLLSRFMKNSDR
jgi:hypothetical protein